MIWRKKMDDTERLKQRVSELEKEVKDLRQGQMLTLKSGSWASLSGRPALGVGYSYYASSGLPVPVNEAIVQIVNALDLKLGWEQATSGGIKITCPKSLP